MTLPQYTPVPVWHPTISEVDDSSPPDASNWNPGTQGLADNCEFLFSNRTHAALNWYPQVPSTDLTASSLIGACAWDPEVRRWLALTFVNGGTPLSQVVASYGTDQGAQWSTVGGTVLPGAAITVSAVCADPATPGTAWQALGTGTDLHVYYFNGATWNVARNPARVPNDVQMATLGNVVVFAASYTDGTPSSDIYGSSNHGSTWFGSSGFPAAIAWFLKSNGLPPPGVGGAGMLIAMPAFEPQTTFDYWISFDGLAWALQHFAALDGGVQKVMGLAWTRDALGPCWIATVQVTTTTTAIYRSPDGIGWALVGPGPTAHRPQSELAGLPTGELVSMTVELTPSSAAEQLWSPDSGASWYAAQAHFSGNLAVGTGYTRPRVVSSDIGFLAWNTEWIRFSHLTGLPPKLT